jgi:SAM-dependent methyltransferase
MNSPERYDKPRRDRYAVGSVTEEFIVPILRDRIERLIDKHWRPMPTPRRVLDVGCGSQPLRASLEAPGSTYVGLDVQQSPLGNVDVIAPLDGVLPAELTREGLFDFLVCTEVLEHVADWHAAFRNLASLTRTGGKILITCPHFYMLHEEPHDFWRPTGHALEFFAQAYGLRMVEREAAGDGWDVLGTLLACSAALPHRPGILPRLGAKFANALRRVGLALLKRRWPQRLARMSSGVYLCNVAVLEKR